MHTLVCSTLNNRLHIFALSFPHIFCFFRFSSPASINYFTIYSLSLLHFRESGEHRQVEICGEKSRKSKNLLLYTSTTYILYIQFPEIFQIFVRCNFSCSGLWFYLPSEIHVCWCTLGCLEVAKIFLELKDSSNTFWLNMKNSNFKSQVIWVIEKPHEFSLVHKGVEVFSKFFNLSIFYGDSLCKLISPV
jgi:hypothetical protein